MALYLGGLLGPFGGGLVNAMLPELADTFDVSTKAVAGSVTVYFVPFAALLLVSGTLGERWGRRRTVQGAYLLYIVGTLICAAAPGLGVFLAGRAVQGAANAFTTPLLLAGLAELVPAQRVGRSMGIYASFQSGGQSLAPLLGGLAAEVNWRFAFAGVALAAAGLATSPPPGEARRAASAPPVRPLFTTRVGLLAAAAGATTMGCVGLAFLVASTARRRFDLGPGVTGLLLVGFGIAGLLSGQLWGRVTDRIGARRCGIAAALAAGALTASIALVPNAVVLAVVWSLAGAAGAALSVAVQSLAASAVPANRGGAVSVTLSFRFWGSAAAPLVWLPWFTDHPGRVFVVAGVVAGLASAALWPLGRVVRGPDTAWARP